VDLYIAARRSNRDDERRVDRRRPERAHSHAALRQIFHHGALSNGGAEHMPVDGVPCGQTTMLTPDEERSEHATKERKGAHAFE
jgi:hypothetical protein